MYSFEASDPAASSMAPLPASHPAHWPFLKGGILSTSNHPAPGMARLQSPWHSFGRRGIRLPAFVVFVNRKCDETGIDMSGEAGLLIRAGQK
jgi:hypothetical protein